MVAWRVQLQLPTHVSYSTEHKYQERKALSDTRCRIYTRLAPALKTIFHQCVMSSTCSQSNSDGSVLRAIRVRLATSIYYDTLMKNCFKDWSQSRFIPP